MYSIPLALFDFIPCVIYLVTVLILQKDLYGKMSRVSYTLYAAGTAMVFFAGIGKAMWKLLIAANVCDFEKLNSMAMPVQSIGFILAGAGLLLFVCKKQKTTLYSAALPVFSGSMIFIFMMVIGVGLSCGSLMAFACKLKKKKIIPLFVLAFVLLLAMGYLGSKNFELSYINWIAEGINTLAQSVLLIGVCIIHKSGLKNIEKAVEL